MSHKKIKDNNFDAKIEYSNRLLDDGHFAFDSIL